MGFDCLSHPPLVATTKGAQDAPVYIVMGHELGHAVGYKDDGVNNMDLGPAERTAYMREDDNP